MYCVYLTTYSGDKLPPYYIGSTTIEKVKSGTYFGTVCSVKWKEIFQQELKNNPQLFSIKILKECKTRKLALIREHAIQRKLDVVKSPDFFNEGMAARNGMFGRDVNGKYNPMYGKKRPDATERMSGDNNIATKEEIKQKLRKPKQFSGRGQNRKPFVAWRYLDRIERFKKCTNKIIAILQGHGKLDRAVIFFLLKKSFSKKHIRLALIHMREDKIVNCFKNGAMYKMI